MHASPRARTLAQLLAASMLLLLAACGGSDAPGGTGTPPPLGTGSPSLSVENGAGQSGVIGTQLPARIRVRVRGANGSPAPGVEVTFAVASGGGRVSPERNTTSSNGETEVTWTLGSASGPQAITASVPGAAPVGVSATATVPPRPVFTVPVVPLDRVVYAYGLGHVNPPGHTLPSDHMYYYLVDCRNASCSLPAPVPVSAPAAGTVVRVDRGSSQVGADDAVFVEVNPAVTYYVIHIRLPESIRVGSRVEAGQSLGVTSGAVLAVDLGVLDRSLTHAGFVNPWRYRGETVHAGAPITYYAEPLRSQLYAKVDRRGAEKDGRVDFDVPGRLSGGWFVQGFPNDPGAGTESWARQLYFLTHVEDPAQQKVSVGGTLAGGAGVYLFGPDARGIASVSPATGAVGYRLYRPILSIPAAQRTQVGLMMVQMLDGATLKAEVFPGDTTGTREFTAAATVYVR